MSIFFLLYIFNTIQLLAIVQTQFVEIREKYKSITQ